MASSNPSKKVVAEYPPPPDHSTIPSNPPAIPDAFVVFGEERKRIEVPPTLEELGHKVLYDPSKGDTLENAAGELRTLVRLLRAEYALLLDSLISSEFSEAESHQLKIRELFVNASYLLNACKTRAAEREVVDVVRRWTEEKREAVATLERATEAARKHASS